MEITTGVDPVVFMFNTVEHAGLQEVEEKDPVAPEGSPETVKELPEWYPKPMWQRSSWSPKIRQQPIYRHHCRGKVKCGCGRSLDSLVEPLAKVRLRV